MVIFRADICVSRDDILSSEDLLFYDCFNANIAFYMTCNPFSNWSTSYWIILFSFLTNDLIGQHFNPFYGYINRCCLLQIIILLSQSNKAINMNTIASKRSPVIQTNTKYIAGYSCTYAGQLNSTIGMLVSVMFDGDYRAEHAHFVMLLNREGSTSETFLSFFEGKLELLQFMLNHYKCTALIEDIRYTSIQMKKNKIVASFVNGIDSRIAARRALDLPMFVPNE